MIIYIYITVVLFVVGASVGSFINALADRIFYHENFVSGRSKCNECNHTLAPSDLIPVFSFLFLGGRCRYCKKKIPADVFISEVLLGILYILVFFVASPLLLHNTYGFYLYFCFLLGILSFFFFIAVYDYKFYIIPDLPVYLLDVAFAVFFIIIFILSLYHIHFMYYENYKILLIQHLTAGVVVFLFFLGIYLVTHGRGLGGGDVKLSFLIGLILGGKPSVIFLYAAFLVGAVVSSLLLLLKKKGMKDALPFGPFLAFGFIVAILYANVLLKTPLFNFVNEISTLLTYN